MSANDISHLFGLCPAQEDLLKQRAVENRVAQTVYQVKGALDQDRFSNAWRAAVTRHIPLRSSVHWKGMEKPIQAVRKTIETSVEHFDWSEFSTNERESKLCELSSGQRDRCLDEARPPLHRIALAKLNEELHFLILSYNELLLDQPSARRLVEEVFGVYADLNGIEAQETPEEMAEGRNDNKGADRRANDPGVVFWRTLLSDFPGATSINLETSSNGKSVTCEGQLDDITMQEVKQLAQLCSCDLETVFLGVWSLLLCCRSQRDDVVFGTRFPASTKGRASAPIGCTSHMLPLRIAMHPSVSVRQWLRDIYLCKVDVESFSSHSLSAVARWSGLSEGAPMFTTSVSVMDGARPISIGRPGASIIAEQIKEQHSRPTDVSLEIELGEPTILRLSIVGAKSEDSMDLLHQFINLLETMCRKNPEVLFEIVGSSKTDGQLSTQGCETGNGTQDWLVHEYFEKVAAMHPEAVAVIFEEEQLTYAELNARANQLARYLHRLGVGPEIKVGVCLPRCLQTAVVVLGILKAGGVYFPLDPECPKDRMAFLVEDADPAVLITQRMFLTDLPLVAAACQLVSIDTDWADIKREDESDPRSLVHPDSLAYVIYTSGSTGRPKGVGVSHRAIEKHLDVISRAFGYLPTDRIALLASLSFDVSIEQLLAALIVGASVAIRNAEVLSRREFREFLRDNSVTVANTTPAFWSEVVADGCDDLSTLSGLRLVILGGDVLRPQLARRWLEGPARSIALINAYGPTEAVITATLNHVSNHERDIKQTVPIGRALQGRTAFVLNHWGGGALVGGQGELYLGGELLARGYIGQPCLTAERFVPDPFSTQPGARLYRTGDRARYFGDGKIEFLGRVDQQVKIRGFRIELEEIEAVLESHPAVSQAAVVARESDPHEKKLAGYVVLSDGWTGTEALRDFLRQKLPDYMIPNSIDTIDAMPLTASGKIDRNMLLAMVEQNLVAAKSPEYLSETEKVLADIWAEALGVSNVAPEDDFFESGGDSITATSVIAKVEKRFAIEIPMRLLFDQPTVRQLASHIETDCNRQSLSAPSAYPPLQRVSRESDLPVTFAQERLFVLSQLRSQASFYNLSGGIGFVGDIDASVLQQALTELVRRHEPLRTVFKNKHDSVVQVIQPAYPVSLDTVDLSTLEPVAAQEQLRSLTQEEAERPYDLSIGPMMRTRLFRLSNQENVLWLTIHHIVGDAQSIGVLLQEFCMSYESLLLGIESPFAELVYQFADYASWQRRWLTEAQLARHVEYWRHQLRGCPQPELLMGERDTTQATYGGSTLTEAISGEVPAKVRELGVRMNATTFVVLLAAWKLLLYSQSRGKDVVVGTHVANRNHPAVESMVGLFINILVLRTDLSGNPRFCELVERVREVVLQAFDHQDMPFDRLIDELRPRTGIDRSPFFNSFFAMQNIRIKTPEISGIKTSLVSCEDRSAKFGLSVFASESEDQINLAFNFKIHKFPNEAIQRMSWNYQSLLREAVIAPELRLDDLIAKAMADPNPNYWKSLTTERSA